MSRRVLPSTLTSLCIKMVVTSLYVSAYLRRLRRMRHRGRHSRVLCGPGLGLGANTPPSLSSIQWLGALSRLRCFLGPRGLSTERSGDGIRDRLGFARDAEERPETARASEGTRATATSADASRGEGADAHLASPSWSRAEVRRKEGRAGLGDASSFANEWRASVR